MHTTAHIKPDLISSAYANFDFHSIENKIEKDYSASYMEGSKQVTRATGESLGSIVNKHDDRICYTLLNELKLSEIFSDTKRFFDCLDTPDIEDNLNLTNCKTPIKSADHLSKNADYSPLDNSFIDLRGTFSTDVCTENNIKNTPAPLTKIPNAILSPKPPTPHNYLGNVTEKFERAAASDINYYSVSYPLIQHDLLNDTSDLTNCLAPINEELDHQTLPCDDLASSCLKSKQLSNCCGGGDDDNNKESEIISMQKLFQDGNMTNPSFRKAQTMRSLCGAGFSSNCSSSEESLKKPFLSSVFYESRRRNNGNNKNKALSDCLNNLTENHRKPVLCSPNAQSTFLGSSSLQHTPTASLPSGASNSPALQTTFLPNNLSCTSPSTACTSLSAVPCEVPSSSMATPTVVVESTKHSLQNIHYQKNAPKRLVKPSFADQPADSSAAGEKSCITPLVLVHPEEFRNPSSFLKVYGDPLCGRVSTVTSGQNGNWACACCGNINYPRRFRCNKCNETRDEKGDEIVNNYVQLVYDQHIRTYRKFARYSNNAHKFKVPTIHINPRCVHNTATPVAYHSAAAHTARLVHHNNSPHSNNNQDHFKRPNQIINNNNNNNTCCYPSNSTTK